MNRQLLTILTAMAFAISGLGGVACPSKATDPVGASTGGGGGPTIIFSDDFEAGITPWSDMALNVGQGQDSARKCNGSFGYSNWQDGPSLSSTTGDHMRRDFSTTATATTTTFCFMTQTLNSGAVDQILFHLELGGVLQWSFGITGAGAVHINGNPVAQSLNVGTLASGTWYTVTITHSGTTMSKFNIQLGAGPAQADESGYLATAAGSTADGGAAGTGILHIAFGDIMHDAGILALDDITLTAP